MEKGTVKWFNDSKGFGFIEPEGGGKDIFVHATNLSNGQHSLEENDKVEYDTEEGQKGLSAINVTTVA